MVALAVFRLGLGHHVDHRIVHVGECDSFGLGDLAGNVAFGGESLVIHLGIGGLVMERVGIDATG